VKVIGIVCSPRKGGNTEIMVREALNTVQEQGGETELITVYDKTINPCDGCFGCEKTSICHINDDMQEIYQKMLEADGIIIGTPVYFHNVTAQAKAIMDRTFAFRPSRKLRGKVAGAIVVTRRVGAGQTRTLLNSYLLLQQMLVAGSAIGYAWREKGEIREGPGGGPDSSALGEARNLGKDMVSLYQQLSR